VSATTGDATVAFYLDDVPLSSGSANNGGALGSNPMGAADPRVLDLNRVEVLRGPQGTLYGASSMGGAIRFITNPPVFNRVEGEVSADSGYTDGAAKPNYQGQLVINVPVVPDHAAFRASVQYGSSAGDINRETYSDAATPAVLTRRTNDADYVVARVVGLIQLTDSLTIRPVLGLTETRLDDLPFFFSTLPRYTKSSNIADPQLDITRLAAVVVEQDWARSKLVSVSAYNARDIHQTQDYGDAVYTTLAGGFPPELAPLLLPFRTNLQIPSRNENYRNVLSQELRLQSDTPDAPLQWLFGAYYARNQWANRQGIEATGWDALGNQIFDPIFGGNPLYTGGRDDLFYSLEHFGSDEYAGFTHETYRITSQWELTAGLRYFRDHRFVDSTQGGFFDGLPGQRVTAPRERDAEHGINPQYGVNFQITPNNLLYFSAAKGFREGGANTPIADNATCNGDIAGYKARTGRSVSSQYAPDGVWSYEIGSKNTLMGGRMIVNGALYYIKWNNIQTLINLDDYAPPGGGGCGMEFTDNIGSAVSKGVELQLQLQLTDRLTVGAAASYDRARVTSEGANDGEWLLNVPEVAASLTADYAARLTSKFKGVAHWDTSYQGDSRRSFNSALPYFEANHYAVSSLRAGVEADRWALYAYATNVFNARTILDDYGQILGDGPAAAIPESPYNPQTTLRGRTVGLSAKFSF
jgi:iron complex outermembrane recepter protein